MRSALIPALLLLAACQQEAPNTTAAPEAKQEPISSAPQGQVTDFSQPMTARGNEPFWAVRMEGTKLTLLRPEQPEVVFEAPGGRIEPGKGVWEAKAADGRTMKLTLYVSECSDGMSDLKYPMAAEAELSGSETLRGCAAKTADLAREAPR